MINKSTNKIIQHLEFVSKESFLVIKPRFSFLNVNIFFSPLQKTECS